ncbi:MAG: glycosyl hydrolase, partial [Saprospiraceae bacterium]|nr:glycosyl hydrolase [Saprospiraceae bacterium]
RSSGSTISASDWERTAGCECGHIAIDPTDQEIVYGGCYGGVIQRQNHRALQTRMVNVWPDNPMGHGAEGMKYRFQWNFPIFFSPHDPKKLYTASNHIHVSTNQGNSWEIISPDLTRNDPSKLGPSGGPITKDNTSVEYYCTIFAAAESPRVKDLLWAGSDDGLIHVSRDGGQDWQNVTPAGLPEWIMINSIEPDPWNDGGCYVAATMYKWGNFQPYLYKTTDYGQTWTKITNGIDPEHFTRVVRADINQKDLLYAGTESGMYISFDDGAHWEPFQLNLPVVPITDVTMKENNLVVATQGRSLWLIDDLNPIYSLAEAKDKKSYLYKPKDTYRMSGQQARNPKTAGKNHAAGAMIYFYLEELTDSLEVSISVSNSEGEIIRSFSNKSKKEDTLEVKSGSNLFVWDLRYADAEDFDGMIMWSGSLNGPRALPGVYQVILKVDDFEQSQELKILRDPRSEAPIEDLIAQFSFVQDVNAKVTEAHRAIRDIRKVRSQMKQLRPLLDNHEQTQDLIEQSEDIEKKMSEIEKALYQTRNESRQDPLNFPIRLTNKLAYLNTLQRGGEYTPTKQSQAVKSELTHQIDQQLKTFTKIIEEDVPAFNSAYKALGLDVLKLESDKKADDVQ